MPLRSALELGPGPRSVHEARQWVLAQILELGRPDLVETTELGVSELVTNAVLHADPPIEVRVRGTRGHPRVEVRDASARPPELPTPLHAALAPADLAWEELLSTVGRGLDIVARSADAWGAEVEEGGKVVWFAPATELRDVGVAGTITGQPDATIGPRHVGTDPYLLLGVPVADLRAFRRHHQELQREVRLLSITHEQDYPLAKTLSDLFGSLRRELHDGLEREGALLPAADGTVDVTVRLSPASADAMGRFVELLDFADEFCSRERMLALARTPDQRAFQTWFLQEFARQRAGAPPRRWTFPAAFPGVAQA